MWHPRRTTNGLRIQGSNHGRHKLHHVVYLPAQECLKTNIFTRHLAIVVRGSSIVKFNNARRPLLYIWGVRRPGALQGRQQIAPRFRVYSHQCWGEDTAKAPLPVARIVHPTTSLTLRQIKKRVVCPVRVVANDTPVIVRICFNAENWLGPPESLLGMLALPLHRPSP